jgi:hypothetical protein
LTVPGLPQPGRYRPIIYITASDVDVDLWTQVGSPTYPVQLAVYVQNSVVLSSSDAAIPALDMAGFADGTFITLVNFGSIIGAGGQGGDGEATGFQQNVSDTRAGPSGGGGAGTVVGPGGLIHPDGPAHLQGEDGQAEAGGAGGTLPDEDVPTIAPGLWFPATDGQAGGTAVRAGITRLTVTNAFGTIWGGGGGGGGGGTQQITNPTDQNFGGNGAANGEPGEDGGADTTLPAGTRGKAGVGGAAGFAIFGNFVTLVDGDTDPNIKGPVGTTP